jgi:hypothetical protein
MVFVINGNSVFHCTTPDVFVAFRCWLESQLCCTGSYVRLLYKAPAPIKQGSMTDVTGKAVISREFGTDSAIVCRTDMFALASPDQLPLTRRHSPKKKPPLLPARAFDT